MEMEDVHFDTEEVIAEPDEPTVGYLTIGLNLLHAYGWYIILAAVGIYFYIRNKARYPTAGGNPKPKSAIEIQEWQSKEEQRLKAIQKLQEKYSEATVVNDEKQKQMEEEKRKARLKEMEKLAGKIDLGQQVGASSTGNKKNLRPEYNPLMGDQGSSGRVCFRRPGGGAGG